MNELNEIFEKLDKKKNLITKYSKRFKELEQDNNLSKKELHKTSKILYKTFVQEMKTIDKNSD